MVFIVPAGNEKKQPLSLSGKHVHGGGSYNDDSKYSLCHPYTHIKKMNDSMCVLS